MYISLLIAALALAAPQDTLIDVERGTRLEVENFRGDVAIEAWGRDEVRINADMSDRQVLDASRFGTTLRVRPRTRNGGPRGADLRIAVPRWMNVRVEGNQVDVRVRDTEGEVVVETVAGEIMVDGGRGLIAVRSIQGEIRARGARGRVEAESVNEEIVLDDIEGEVFAETTNGDITLRGIRSSLARARTVNGDLDYDGTIADDGRYALVTHNGDLEVSVAEGTNATVSVSTYHGEFEAEFPVRLTGTSQDKQFNFTLGSGQAQLELETFNGEITLRRPR